ncbi:hypothetical protein R6Q59_034573 [Mikania micrantha]
MSVLTVKHRMGSCMTTVNKVTQRRVMKKSRRLQTLNGKPKSLPRHNVVSVVHLGVHFINVTLQGYYPMPTVNPIWKRYRNDAASDWEFVYHDRPQEYQRFVDENKLVDYIDV